MTNELILTDEDDERCPRCASDDLEESLCDVTCNLCGFSWEEETEAVGSYDD